MPTTVQGKHRLINTFTIILFFVIAAMPFLLSVSFHTGILYLSKNMTWQFSQDDSSPEKVPATIVLDGQRDDGLKFQGTDPLDSFFTEDKMVYPSPEIEYRSITPEVEFYPDARVSEELDIISIEAAAMDNQWVNPSTGRQPLYTGPEKFVGSFSRHIQVLREGGLDVVFIFDATASMQSFLKQVKQKIENLAAAFKKLVPTCRIGLVAYRDVDEESEFVTRVHPLVYSTGPLHDFLEEIGPKGGADRAEAVYQGLADAVDKMEWHDTAKKIILVIGDAPPHAEEMPLALELIETFRLDMGGTVSVLDTRAPEYEQTAIPSGSQKLSSDLYSYSADDEDVMDEFRILAQTGQGESARLENEEVVVKKMLLLIFGERWEMYLSEFMKNL